MQLARLRLALLLGLSPFASSQVKHISVPLGDAVTKALERQTLVGEGAEAFHIRVTISEPANQSSPYQGSIEEWWASPRQWRREVTSTGEIRQVIVVRDGTRTEVDTGDYFPLWLGNFVSAVLDPVPDAAAWLDPGNTLEQTMMPNGAKSDACVRAKSQIGSGSRATDAFFNLCLDAQAHIGFYGSPRYSMEFHDYRGFGKKQYPRQLVSNPEPGTRLVGEVVLLEDLAKVGGIDALFRPLSGNDTRFTSVRVNAATMERLSEGAAPIAWPPIRSGNVRGRLAMYLSVDRDGHVREAWPLNSDNAGLEDPARDQVRQWTLKPATDKGGNRVAVDGPISFAFETVIGDPLPELSDSEVRALATHAVEPVWPAGALQPGEVVEVQVSVDEQGKLAGASYPKTPAAAVGPVMNALDNWSFRPLLRNGKPQYFHGTVRFVVP